MERLKIQQKICAVVQASTFYEVKYEPGSGAPIDTAVDAPNVLPDSVRTNEISSTFNVDKLYGQDFILKQNNWTFVLFLEWNNKEVDLSYFERGLMVNMPFIPRTDTTREVRLFLLKKDVTHPVQQDASTGTQAKYLFQAELGRA